MSEEKKTKTNNLKKLPLEEYMKLLPLPPKEHYHELMMEKRVKDLLKEQK